MLVASLEATAGSVGKGLRVKYCYKDTPDTSLIRTFSFPKNSSCVQFNPLRYGNGPLYSVPLVTLWCELACHSKTRSDLSLQQRLKPLPLLLLVAIEIQHLHVTSVRGGAVEHLSQAVRENEKTSSVGKLTSAIVVHV